jgi:hypothetical protein
MAGPEWRRLRVENGYVSDVSSHLREGQQ